MNEYLGRWLWRRLKKDSEVYSWFSTLPEGDQEYMWQNISNFVKVIKEDFLRDQWQILINDIFKVQQFQQQGFKQESLQAFINQHMIYTCMLIQINDSGLQEINIVMRKALIVWRPILNMSTINNSKQLLAQVIKHSKALIVATKSKHSLSRIPTSDLVSALRSIGIEPLLQPHFATSHTANLASGSKGFEYNLEIETEKMSIDDLLELESVQEQAEELLKSAY